MNRTERLYELQHLDAELETASRRLKEITARLGESADLKRARKMTGDAQTHFSKCRAHMQDLDLEVNGLSQKIQIDEKQLYSGRVTNSKELASLQEEVASLKRRREKREEDLLDAMVATEEAEAAVADAQAILTQVSEAWSAAQEKMTMEQTQIQARIADLGARREAFAASIGPEDMAIYERLRQKKAGRAVAVVKDGICQGCRMNPPSSQVQHARTGTELVFCNNCSRILYVP